MCLEMLLALTYNITEEVNQNRRSEKRDRKAFSRDNTRATSFLEGLLSVIHKISHLVTSKIME